MSMKMDFFQKAQYESMSPVPACPSRFDVCVIIGTVANCPWSPTKKELVSKVLSKMGLSATDCVRVLAWVDSALKLKYIVEVDGGFVATQKGVKEYRDFCSTFERIMT